MRPGAGGDDVSRLPFVRAIVRKRLLELQLILAADEGILRVQDPPRPTLVHNPPETAAAEAVLMYAHTVAPAPNRLFNAVG